MTNISYWLMGTNSTDIDEGHYPSAPHLKPFKF